MNLAAFRVKHPEWNTAQPDAFVQAYLDEAARSISPEAAGDRFDDMHGLLTCHLLSLSPHGKNSRLAAPANAKSTYKDRYDAMVIEVTCGVSRAIP